MTLGTLPDWCEQTWSTLATLAIKGELDGNDIFGSKCHPLQRKRELATMMKLARPYLAQNGTAIEIGTSRGGGAIFWPTYGAQRVGGYDINGHPFEPHFRTIHPDRDWER